MIVAKRKPIDEIVNLIRPYKNILILGCGTCVTVCNSGGEREVSLVHSALRVSISRGILEDKKFEEYTVKRQCDREFLEVLKPIVRECDAMLSLACGVGVQVLSEFFPEIPCIPGVDTVFMGSAGALGLWDERCIGCGECRLYETGGICPLTRCAKGILNGPCGGSKDGKCEARRDMDCGWILIYKRLNALNQLDRMRRYFPPRNHGNLLRPKRVKIE